MNTFDVPEWITEILLANGVGEDDYHLYGAGRALGFVRMAAHALDESIAGDGLPFKEAEYHTYAGISACRTAIDATASWLNRKLQLGLAPSPRINLSRIDYQKKIFKECAGIQKQILVLGELGKYVDIHRQRAQHREGLAIMRHLKSVEKNHEGGWYIAPEGLNGDRASDLLLKELLFGWADEIEANMRAIHKGLSSNEELEVDHDLDGIP